MRYVLGFDGGGTKTDSVLMDETGVILARARSGSSNPTTFGVEASLTALSAAAREALRAAERSEQDIAYLVAGVSGAGEPAMHLAVQSGLQPRIPNAKICITSDLVLSLAATGEIPRVVGIAGTGSSVFGITEPAELACAGGFGALIGDAGCAYAVGLKVTGVILRNNFNGE